MSNRVALISGASKGLGAATARLLGQRGLSVVVNYHSDADGAAAVVADIKAAGGQALAVGGDVTREADVARLVETTLSMLGRLDILVSNAAFPYVQKAVIDLTLAEFELKVHAEVRAAFLLTQAAVPPMTAQGWGRLIYISSDHARGPSAPRMVSHGVSKAALNTFAKYVAHEVGRRNITANVVQCGLMRTAASTDLPQAFRDAFLSRLPLDHIAESEDMAGAVAFLAGDDSRFVTGQVLAVNGGIGLSQFAPPEPAPAGQALNK